MLVTHHGSLVARSAATATLETPPMRKLLALIANFILIPVRMAKGAIQWILQPGLTPAAEEEQAASRAETQAETQQRRADNAQDARELVASMRKVLGAVALGNRPDPAHTARLPRDIAAYITNLTADEAKLLMSRPSRSLRPLLDGRELDGVRPMAQVAGDVAVAQMQATAPDRTKVANRIAERRQVRDVNAILADIALAA